MDRGSDRSLAGALMGFSLFEDGGPDVGLRMDLHGQYVTPTGMGGFVTLPISYLSGGDESETAVGNLDIGGLYAVKGSVPVILRASLLLATADDSLNGVLTNFYAGFGRFTDFPGLFPETTWLRLSASPVIRNGNFFARADIGLDVPISKPDGAEIDPFIRVNLGAGMLVGDSAAVMAELVTVGTTEDAEGDADRFLHTAAISARFYSGKLQPVASVVLPLDEELDGINAILMAGVQMLID